MLQITYVSSAWPPLTAGVVAEILDVSRRNNARAGVTGLLVHDGRRFLQVLEGEESSVRDTIERIRGDMRHRAIVILGEREIAAREFGEWSMACSKADAPVGDETLGVLVDVLVAGVSNPNTRALFTGFARIERRAA